MKEQLQNNYGFLFSEDLISDILENGILKEVKEGDQLINFGDTIKFMPLLLEGALKIMRQDNDGDELLLYFLERGDTCAMTMTCCMGQTKSEIKAVAETDSSMIMIPVQFMDSWMKKHDTWRSYVFESYNTRFHEMLEAIDSLAFLDMHGRLEKYLRDKVLVNKDAMLSVTHQEIAYDLHTSRVVVSRLLKALEKEEKIKLHRNKVEVLVF